jgi:hypothetical protein
LVTYLDYICHQRLSRRQLDLTFPTPRASDISGIKTFGEFNGQHGPWTIAIIPTLPCRERQARWLKETLAWSIGQVMSALSLPHGSGVA